MSVFRPSKTVVMREDSGNLTANETSTPISGLEEFDHAVVLLNLIVLTTVTAGDEIDVYLQTTYDSGTTWSDIENFHIENPSSLFLRKLLLCVTPNRPTAADVAEASTDGTLTDTTKLDLPLGSQLRFKVSLTDTGGTPIIRYESTAYLYKA